MKPLAIDLYAGLGGWSEGLLAEGFDVIGFDIERHHYGDAKYPSQLVIQDVLTLHGSQFKDADLIVASPPCQEYSYMAMPWSRAKAIAAEYRAGVRDVAQLTALFDACFRIQREAIEATKTMCARCQGRGNNGGLYPHSCDCCAGQGWTTRHIPLVVENVRGAQPWVGRARWNFGSFYLWGDVPALMPMTSRRGMKGSVGTINGSGKFREQSSWDRGQKVPGFRFDGSGKSFQTASVERTKNMDAGGYERDHPSAFGWNAPRTNSKSNARKAASAAIAKIPFALAQHVGRSWKPAEFREAA